MTQNRWAPVLPSFGGRLAPRVTFVEGNTPTTYNSRLLEYYLLRRSSLNMFSHKVDAATHRKYGCTRGVSEIPRSEWGTHFLETLVSRAPNMVYAMLLDGFGSITMSRFFRDRLKSLVYSRDLGTIKRWYQTVDGLVYPILLTVEDPDLHYAEIDRMVKFGFESCANNYSHFTSRMKTLKRLLRKDYALDTEVAKSMHDVRTYWNLYTKFFPSDGANPHLVVQYVLCWAQTRASGLADQRMVRKSLDKCEETLKTPRRPTRLSTPAEREYHYRDQPVGVPVIDTSVLRPICWRISERVRGEKAHVSAGPNSCLESTRQSGGQTGYIKRLARSRSLHSCYDHCTLELTVTDPRPVRSVKDLVDWSIQEVLEHPVYTRCVRLHSVAEPSKARTITVCSLPYLTVVGVVSKLLQPAIASDITRAGLSASRNLWKFLYEDLDPNLGLWGRVRDDGPRNGPIWALSSDLSEATDYGDLGVARQILQGILEKCESIPGFPLGLCVLAKSLFIGKRFCLRQNDSGQWYWFLKRNGWLMGDRLTKVILTLAHEIVLVSSGIYCSRICGDDVIALSKKKDLLEKYFGEVTRLGFKVSEEDSYISQKLAFYCEEAMIPPLRYLELPAVACRRRSLSNYVDYPRIRLLIPTHVESDRHSYTDIGRFTLLGKETRWVIQNDLRKSIPLFERAGLLQHLHVPQSSDTLCPYTPVELGGDGGCPTSSRMMSSIVQVKSRDLSETIFRMEGLLSSKWGYRYVRSARLNDVVHKYHTLVPRLTELKTLLPAGSILEGSEFLLSSLKVQGLETPEKTFFRIWRAHYWDTILKTGREPGSALLPTVKAHSHLGSEVDPDWIANRLHTFWETWLFKGFVFKDTPDFLVIQDSIHVLDYMNMGWKFGLPPLPGPRDPLNTLGLLLPKLMNEENSFNFISHMANDCALDPKVRDTLYKYVETDSYLKFTLQRRWDREGRPHAVLLVSKDKKLAVELHRILNSRSNWRTPVTSRCWSEVPGMIFLVDPEIYMFGMMTPFEEYARTICSDTETVEDFGAIAYAAAHSDGQGFYYENPHVVAEPLYSRRDRAPFYWQACRLVLVPEDSSGGEAVSLTTQGRTQFRPSHLLRFLKKESQE